MSAFVAIAEDASFQVRIASTGATFEVPPETSIARVLIDHGVEVPLSCEQGVCGTCLTGVLQGVPDHRDLFLTDSERAESGLMTLCCSRSLSPLLVLDL